MSQYLFLRRRATQALLWLSLGAPLGAQSGHEVPEPSFDIVIVGGTVMDPESGFEAITNVGIRDGTIAAISSEVISGRTVISAEGLVVAPGFIDLDSYPQLARFQVTDGVTTMFDIRSGTASVDAWYAERSGTMPIHYGVGVGFRWVRHEAMAPTPPYQADLAATEDELAEILSGLQAGLEQGAVAIGMGPGRHPYLFWELLHTLRLAAEARVPVVAPLRDGIWAETDVPANLSELVGAAQLTGASMHISYLSSSGGPHTPKLLDIIAQARSRGLDITVEDYPYLGAVVGGFLVDETMSEEELRDIFLVSEGRTLTPADVERYRDQPLSVVILNSSIGPYVTQSVASPLTSIASHGFLDDELRGHPRTSGTYSRVLGRYVREEGRIALMDALRKMTLLPAQRLQDRVPGMRRKGRVQVGADADLVVFDPQRIADRATYEAPTRPPEGILHVLVGGVAVVQDGELITGVYPGEPVRGLRRWE